MTRGSGGTVAGSTTRAALTALTALSAVLTSAPAGAQELRGTVVETSTGRPVSWAMVALTDREREVAAVAIADSLGRYVLATPGSGEYLLVAERFGYLETVSPLLAIDGGKTYQVELELHPEPLGLAPLTVTVRNEQLIDWLTLELGSNPVAARGFRVLQGPRLQEAKLRGKNKTTETLRFLFIPVSHGLACVSINSIPRATSVGFRGARRSAITEPGAPPAGTMSREEIAEASRTAQGSCGSLMLNDRVIPNEQLESIDMSSVALVVTLGSSVRMYTYDFNWAFR